jgi:hypothetical protein
MSNSRIRRVTPSTPAASPASRLAPATRQYPRCLTRAVELKAASTCRAPSRAKTRSLTRNLLLLLSFPKMARKSPLKMGEETMTTKNLVLASCAAIVLSVATAQAGPCNTGDKTARDAGSGPTPGNTGQTVGTAATNAEHPPTSTMNRATGDVAASAQDAQRQMQGQPTATQQGKGAAQSPAATADQGC